MGLFPKIQSPCPYRGPLTDIMDGEVCRLCKKEVVDLTAMGDDGRRRFIESCAGEVCISYKVMLRPALVAAVAGVTALATPSAAVAQELITVMVGGIRAPQSAEWVEHSSATNLPELPVVYEDASDTSETKPQADTETKPTNAPQVRVPAGT